MSHFTKVATKLRCQVTLRKALEEMGYETSDKPQRIRGFGQTAHADIVAKTGIGLDLGFLEGAEGYEAIADWDFLERKTGVDQADFMGKLKRTYSYLKVMDEVEKAGYAVVAESQGEGGAVTLRVRRWSEA